ncbi:putative ankyrin repeat protein RF_0381 isoform X1 [Bradysia coprophila]|uniref:putative ankyrin repeat protein RF_0381 isoform X1 n=1 Tax=Bradysia coprophila TaxID=38358 RepID=UPI00187D9B04|nr:putative ankyrin repeat protein RF_0381 isoform X1 [Bradysia coprophila]
MKTASLIFCVVGILWTSVLAAQEKPKRVRLAQVFRSFGKNDVRDDINLFLRTYEDEINNKGGCSPLHIAALFSEKVVDYLIKNGSDVNALDNGNLSPLYFAAEGGNDKIVEMLVNNGADVSISNNKGMTELHVAAYNGFDKIADILIKAGANVDALNEVKWTPLFYAGVNDSVPVANLLIQNGAQVNAQNNDGLSILAIAIIAADSERYNCVEFLLNNGADPNLAKEMTFVPLYFAVQNGNAKIVELLIQKGANVNFRDEDQLAPLHFASIKGGTREIIELLVNNGADVNHSSKHGATALLVAISERNTVVANALIAIGADVNRAEYKYGQLPLHLAAQHGITSTIRLLIEKGANLQGTDNDNNTPLHYAAESGKYAAVNALIRAGADVNAVTNDGVTPLKMAIHYRHLRVSRLLRNNGGHV